MGATTSSENPFCTALLSRDGISTIGRCVTGRGCAAGYFLRGLAWCVDALTKSSGTWHLGRRGLWSSHWDDSPPRRAHRLDGGWLFRRLGTNLSMPQRLRCAPARAYLTGPKTRLLNPIHKRHLRRVAQRSLNALHRGSRVVAADACLPVDVRATSGGQADLAGTSARLS
jgi:hypothetical protein